MLHRADEAREAAHVRDDAAPRRPWIAPEVADLPRLTDLTLQTGGGIGGDESVFP